MNKKVASQIFVIAVIRDFYMFPQVTCTILAALLHWFVLAVFCWILVEFLQLNLCVHCGWNRRQSRLKYFAFLGWGTCNTHGEGCTKVGVRVTHLGVVQRVGGTCNTNGLKRVESRIRYMQQILGCRLGDAQCTHYKM